MRTFKRLFTIGLLCLSTLSFAKVDIIPQSLKFREGLDDDVSMSYSQHTFVYVKNVGTQAFQTMKRIGVSLNGEIHKGYLYGPDNNGGMLGGPVAVGQVGKVFLRLPLDTLKHCQAVNVRIDTARQVQSGYGVYNNDYKKLTALDLNSNLFCLKLPPRRRLPRRPLPLLENMVVE